MAAHKGHNAAVDIFIDPSDWIKAGRRFRDYCFLRAMHGDDTAALDFEDWRLDNPTLAAEVDRVWGRRGVFCVEHGAGIVAVWGDDAPPSTMTPLRVVETVEPPTFPTPPPFACVVAKVDLEIDKIALLDYWELAAPKPPVWAWLGLPSSRHKVAAP